MTLLHYKLLLNFAKVYPFFNIPNIFHKNIFLKNADSIK